MKVWRAAFAGLECAHPQPAVPGPRGGSPGPAELIPPRAEHIPIRVFSKRGAAPGREATSVEREDTCVICHLHIPPISASPLRCQQASPEGPNDSMALCFLRSGRSLGHVFFCSSFADIRILPISATCCVLLSHPPSLADSPG